MPPTSDEAAAFVEWLAFDYDESETVKGKLQEGVQRYSKWLHYWKNRDEWEFDYNFDIRAEITSRRTSSRGRNASKSGRPPSDRERFRLRVTWDARRKPPYRGLIFRYTARPS